jgi:hypothetical protein
MVLITNGIDKDAYKLQDNFTFLHGLKILDDVIILCLQEEFLPFQGMWLNSYSKISAPFCFLAYF